MKTSAVVSAIVAGLLLNMAWAGTANAENPVDLQKLSQDSLHLQAKYPVGSLTTEEQAESALTQARQVQLSLQTWAEQAETSCYERFFVYACLQEVRETRRMHSDKLQAIILDANSTQRRLRLQQRDQELLEKNVK